MKPRHSPSATTAAAETPFPERLRSAAFWVLLTVAVVRPTLPEEWVYSELWASADSAAGEDLAFAWPTPSVSLGMTLAVAVAGCLWVASMALEGRLTWRTGTGWPALALIVTGTLWATVPTGDYRPADLRAATTAAGTWLGEVALFVLLVQLLTDRRRLRLLLAGILATTLLISAKAVYQVAVEMPATRVFYESRRAAEAVSEGIARRATGGPVTDGPSAARPSAADGLGVSTEDDDRRTRWMEDRLNKASATGWVVHSNILGTLLMMGSPLAVGWALDALSRTRRERRGGYLLAAGAAVTLIVVALLMTRSRGALLAWALGLAGLAAVRMFPAAAVRHRWTILGVGAAVLAAVVGTVVARGVSVGGLPEVKTLDLRWQYWTTAVAILRDTGSWLRGLGPGNFGAWYPGFMPEAGIEEVQNPHCVPLQAFAELGLLGGLGLLAWAGWLAWRAAWFAGAGGTTASATAGTEPKPAETGPATPEPAANNRLVKAALTATILLALTWTVIGRPPAFMWPFVVAVPALLWMMAFLLANIGPTGPDGQVGAVADSDGDGPAHATGGSALSATLTAVGFALLGAFLHGLTDFNLFWPASGTVILALAAAWSAGLTLSLPAEARARSLPVPPMVGLLAVAAAGVLTLAFAMGLWRPAARVDELLADARARFANPDSEKDIATGIADLVRITNEIDPDQPAAWDGLIEAYWRKYRRAMAEDRELAAGRRTGGKKLDTTEIRNRLRMAAVGQLAELERGLTALMLLRPRDPSPFVLKAEMRRVFADDAVAAFTSEERPELGIPAPVEDVPMFGPVLADWAVRGMLMERYPREVREGAAFLIQALRLKPNDARLHLATARMFDRLDGLPDAALAARHYRRAKELSDAAAKYGEGLTAAALAEIAEALPRAEARRAALPKPPRPPQTPTSPPAPEPAPETVTPK